MRRRLFLILLLGCDARITAPGKKPDALFAEHAIASAPGRVLMSEERKRIGAVTVDPDLRRVFEAGIEGAARLNAIVDELISERVQGDSENDQRVATLLYHYLAAHCRVESEKLFKRLSDKVTTEPGSRTELCSDMPSGSRGEESAAQLEGLLSRLSW
jgi:hypothetical protein